MSLLISVKRSFGAEPATVAEPLAQSVVSDEVRARLPPLPVRAESNPALAAAPGPGSSPVQEQPRTRTGRKPKGEARPRRKRTAAAPDPTSYRFEWQAVVIGTDHTRDTAHEHAVALLRCMRANGAKPGAGVMYGNLRDIYRDMCDHARWLQVPWGGPKGIGKALRALTGGKKRRRDIHSANTGAGQPAYRSERIYFMPDWERFEAQVAAQAPCNLAVLAPAAGQVRRAS